MIVRLGRHPLKVMNHFTAIVVFITKDLVCATMTYHMFQMAPTLLSNIVYFSIQQKTNEQISESIPESCCHSRKRNHLLATIMTIIDLNVYLQC